MIKKLAGALLCVIIISESTYLFYAYLQLQRIDNFNCTANLLQHYSDETYYLTLNFIVNDNFGVVHITGRSDKHPKKIVNRKISFKLQRNRDLYYMTSQKNISLPDDNISDEDLSHYIPAFFVTTEKDIYMQIQQQHNKNFLFKIESIPTYVCNANSGKNR